MKIGALDNINFNGYLDLSGKKMEANPQQGKIDLKPCRKTIHVQDITSIDMTNKNIVITYQDTINKYDNIYLPLKYKNDSNHTTFKDLICFNTIINAYNAAKNKNVHIFVPEFDENI